jgi:iron(III) transport system permease protein
VFDPNVYAALGNTLHARRNRGNGVLLLGALTAALGRGGRAGRSLGTLVTLSFAVSGLGARGRGAAGVRRAAAGHARDHRVRLRGEVLGARAPADRRRGRAVPDDLVRAARVSGAGPVGTVRTVVAPLLRPALLAAWLLVFLFAVHELTISSLLYGPGNETLAVVILNQQQLGDVAGTSALSVVLTLVIAVGAGLLLLARRAAVRTGASS